MTMTDKEFYECDNPDCRLRFPGYDDNPKRKRCPVCRSSIHLVAKASNYVGVKGLPGKVQPYQVEGLLDNIRSSWNVGSIFRTSDGVGIQKLYLCGITATPDNAKVGKTALGAEKSVTWEKCNNGVETARSLQSKGKALWVLEDLPGAQPLFSLEHFSTISEIILIVGNEINGVDPGIVELCNKIISIPMRGRKQSYNVAVAFGIAASFLLYRHSVSQGSDNIFPRT
jgi:23S rRNA (guanosine2251-2'-O)-methyltransferase